LLTHGYGYLVYRARNTFLLLDVPESEISQPRLLISRPSREEQLPNKVITVTQTNSERIVIGGVTSSDTRGFEGSEFHR
jgi:hypothetical protein